MKVRVSCAIAAAALAAAVVWQSGSGGGSVVAAQAPQGDPRQNPPGQARPVKAARVLNGIEIVQVRPNFYLLAGAGANISLQIGPDGVIVVDAGNASKTEAVLAAIKAVTDQPIRFVINTSGGPDHVGGNAKLAAAGQTLFNVEGNPSRMTLTNNGAATIISTESVLQRMSQPPKGAEVYPPEAWTTEPFFEKRKVMYFNGEGIEMLAQPAHSEGDALVFFRRSDVVVAGEVIDTTRFPVIDLENGGTIQGEIEALNRLVELAIPSVPFDWRDDGTVVIPARGRILDQVDVADYRDMVTIVRDRVAALIKEGRSLADVQAANPTQGFTRRYGSDSGAWTTAKFVEAVFKSLSEGAEQ